MATESIVSYSIARYLGEIGKTLASPALTTATDQRMARQLMLTMARMSAHLAVDQEYGRSIQQALASNYLARLVDMLPELETLEAGSTWATTIRGWKNDGGTLPALAELETIAGKAAVLL